MWKTSYFSDKSEVIWYLQDSPESENNEIFSKRPNCDSLTNKSNREIGEKILLFPFNGWIKEYPNFGTNENIIGRAIFRKNEAGPEVVEITKNNEISFYFQGTR